MPKERILLSRRAGGLGDVICASVAMRAAREKHGGPDGEFTVCATYGLRRWVELFQDQNIVDEWASHEVARASDESIDAQFTFHFSLDGPEWKKMTSTNWAPQNRIDTWLSSIDCEPSDRCPHWTPRPDEIEWARQYATLKFRGLAPDLQGAPLVIIQALPARGMPWKRWPYMPELAAKLATDHRVLVLHDEVLMEYRTLESVCGVVFDSGLDLRQLGSVLSLADLVIAPDSAFVHFAAAVGVKCLGLFGGTDGATTIHNYGPKSRYLQAPIDQNWLCAKTAPCAGMSSRAFWCIGEQHPNYLGECMKNLAVETVYDAAVQFLSESIPPNPPSAS